MQALLADGSSNICCMPCKACEDDDGWLYVGCSLEAKIKEDLELGSAGSGGSETKCKISAADVPI